MGSSRYRAQDSKALDKALAGLVVLKPEELAYCSHPACTNMALVATSTGAPLCVDHANRSGS